VVACHFAFSKFGKPEVRDASWFAIHPSSAASWEGCRRIKVVLSPSWVASLPGLSTGYAASRRSCRGLFQGG
jgi:hypothetical protein